MGNWLKRYKILGGTVFAGLVCLLLFYMLTVRPGIDDVREMREDLASKEKRLGKSKWPMQKDSLQKILAEEQKRLEGKGGLKALSEEAMKLACSALHGRMMASGYNKTADFRTGVLNSQFQQEFSDMQARFERKGLYVCPEILNLSLTTKSKFSYQLLLQCWCVDMLVDMAGKSGLRFRKHDEISATALDGSRQPAALISVLPMTAYSLDDKKDSVPFLLEFPVRLGVEGTLEQIATFLQSINVAGQFFGVRGFEILSPAPSKAMSENSGKAEILQLNIECAAYLRI